MTRQNAIGEATAPAGAPPVVAGGGVGGGMGADSNGSGANGDVRAPAKAHPRHQSSTASVGLPAATAEVSPAPPGVISWPGAPAVAAAAAAAAAAASANQVLVSTSGEADGGVAVGNGDCSGRRPELDGGVGVAMAPSSPPRSTAKDGALTSAGSPTAAIATSGARSRSSSSPAKTRARSHVPGPGSSLSPSHGPSMSFATAVSNGNSSDRGAGAKLGGGRVDNSQSPQLLRVQVRPKPRLPCSAPPAASSAAPAPATAANGRGGRGGTIAGAVVGETATEAGGSQLQGAKEALADGGGKERRGESLVDIQTRLQQVDALSAKIDTAMMAVEDRLPAVGGVALTRDVDCRRRRVPTARLQQHMTDVQRHSRQRGGRRSDPRPPPEDHLASASATAASAAAPAILNTAARSGEGRGGGGVGRRGHAGTASGGNGGAGSNNNRKRKLPESGTGTASGAAADSSGNSADVQPPSGPVRSICTGGSSSSTAASTAAAQAVARAMGRGQQSHPAASGAVLDSASTAAWAEAGTGVGTVAQSSSVAVGATASWDASTSPPQQQQQQQQQHQQQLQQQLLQQQHQQQQHQQQQWQREVGATAVQGGGGAVSGSGGSASSATRSVRGGAGSGGGGGTGSRRDTPKSLRAAAEAAEAAAEAAEAATVAMIHERVKRREESKVAAAAAAALEAKAAEARMWEECVDEGEAFVTAMLASVVRSLAEGPKTETELDQSVRSDMDAGRAAAGLPVADWSESHMVNVRLVVDVLIALGLVRSDYNTVEQSIGWPMDVHPPSERHGGAPAPCFCSSVMRRAMARHTKMAAPSVPTALPSLPTSFAMDPFQLGIPWNPGSAGGGGGGNDRGVSAMTAARPPGGNSAVYGVPSQVVTPSGVIRAAIGGRLKECGGAISPKYEIDTGSGGGSSAVGAPAGAGRVVEPAAPVAAAAAAYSAAARVADMQASTSAAVEMSASPRHHGRQYHQHQQQWQPQQQEQQHYPHQPSLPRLPGLSSSDGDANPGAAGLPALSSAERMEGLLPLSELGLPLSTMVAGDTAGATIGKGGSASQPSPTYRSPEAGTPFSAPSAGSTGGLAPSTMVAMAVATCGAAAGASVVSSASQPSLSPPPSGELRMLPRIATLDPAKTGYFDASWGAMAEWGVGAAEVGGFSGPTDAGYGAGSISENAVSWPPALSPTQLAPATTPAAAPAMGQRGAGPDGAAGSEPPMLPMVSSGASSSSALQQIDETMPRSSSSSSSSTNSKESSPPRTDGPEPAGSAGPSPTPSNGTSNTSAACALMWPAYSEALSSRVTSYGSAHGTSPRAPLPPPLFSLTTPPRIANTAVPGVAGGEGLDSSAPKTGGTGREAGVTGTEGLPDSLSLMGLNFEGVFSPSQLPPLDQERQKLALLHNVSSGGEGAGDGTSHSLTLPPPATSTFPMSTLGVTSRSPSGLVTVAGSSDSTGDGSGDSIAAMELDVLDAGSTTTLSHFPMEVDVAAAGGSMATVATAATSSSAGTVAGGGGFGDGIASDLGLVASLPDMDAKAALYSRFLRDPTGVTAPSTAAGGGTNDEFAGREEGTAHHAAAAAAASSGSGGGLSAAASAVNGALGFAARGTGAPASAGVPPDVVAIGEDLSEEAKALAEEGLFDLVRDAWGSEASERAHVYVEEEALPCLPIDSRAFALAVEGRLEPGGEVEVQYGKPAVEMLHLWLHLKSDSWVRWRETQDSRGLGDIASSEAAGARDAPDAALSPSGAGGCNRNSISAAAAAAARSGASSAPGRKSGGAPGRTPARRAPNHGSTRSGTRSRAPAAGSGSKAGKNGGLSKGKAGCSSAEKGAGSESEGGLEGLISSGGNKLKRVRYRLDGEHDRVLIDWEEPAREALQLELEAARLALCEEAVLRDLLRRCGIALPPGYARADAVNKLRGGRSKNGGGPSPPHLSAPPPAAAEAAGASAAPGSGSSRARGSGGGGSRGPPRARGGKVSRVGLRRSSSSASASKLKSRGGRRRKSECSMEIDSSDDDRSSFSDSSHTSHRYRGRSGPGRPAGGSGGLFDELPGGSSSSVPNVDSETGALIVPPCQRGFTPGLTAAEAIKLAKQNALAAEAGLAMGTLGPMPSSPGAALDAGGVAFDGSFSIDDGRGSPPDEGIAAGSGGWAEAAYATEGGGKSGRVSPGGVATSRRRMDSSMLTPSIRRPPLLLLGSHNPRTFGDGSGDGLAAATHGGGFDENVGEEGGSPRRRSLSPGEPFFHGLPKAISWSDVARQFTPISASDPSGGSHPLPSPVGRGDSLRASAFPATLALAPPPATAPLPPFPTSSAGNGTRLPVGPTASPFAPREMAIVGGGLPSVNVMVPTAAAAGAAVAASMAFGPPQMATAPGGMVVPAVGSINHNVYGGGSVAEVLAAAVAAVAAAAAAEAVVAAAPAMALSSSFGQGVMSSASLLPTIPIAAALPPCTLAGTSPGGGGGGGEVSSTPQPNLRITVSQDMDSQSAAAAAVGVAGIAGAVAPAVGVTMANSSGDHGSGDAAGVTEGTRLERVSSTASGIMPSEIIAPTFRVVATADDATSKGAGLAASGGSSETAGATGADIATSDEDTDDEAFARRHTEHLARMKTKIEAARRARELASPRPHTKKRAASFGGGRSTPRSSQGGASAGVGGGAGGWSAVAGANSRGAAGRRAAAARTKARSGSESGSSMTGQRGRSRKAAGSSGGGGSPRSPPSTQQPLSPAQGVAPPPAAAAADVMVGSPIAGAGAAAAAAAAVVTEASFFSRSTIPASALAPPLDPARAVAEDFGGSAGESGDGGVADALPSPVVAVSQSGAVGAGTGETTGDGGSGGKRKEQGDRGGDVVMAEAAPTGAAPAPASAAAANTAAAGDC